MFFEEIVCSLKGVYMSRIAVLEKDLCTKERCGYLCEKCCPINRMSKECVIKEKDTGLPIINEELCIGCGICVKKCPGHAIKIINLKEEIGEPIFQYARNAFRIYGLPLPRNGVSGLVGRNGIGKTTALKLLTKQIKPNFGEYRKRFSEEEIIERLSIEQKHHWETTGKGAKLSYKPQNINQIKELLKGTVLENLKKFNKEKTNETIKKFSLEKILNRELTHLAGGEIQKIAIAIAYMKEADIYFFDEPTTYLDIGERMHTALLLQELGERKKVMLAEHDLAILDYASNYVYIFWGETGAYGAVSSVKNIRNGINEYLLGFLKNENIKFREKEINFSEFSEEEGKRPVKFSYSEIKKAYDNFKFSAEKGEIREGEIIGIVGRNALGKTTFVKILAGIEKADKGRTEKFRVSYKPQYIEVDDTLTVEELLSSKDLNPIILNECKIRLDINRIMLRKLSELSGGELQRVALTHALSTEADIYLLDEPSAFLDIEQRLGLAEFLRSIFTGSDKSIFIVDHDIIFVDAVSSRIIVFNGEQSIEGYASSPTNKKDGMNMFLKTVGITMRRDKDSNRPKINKPNSVLDTEQKRTGKYYY